MTLSKRLAIIPAHGSALNSTTAAAEKMGLGEWAFVAGYFKLYAAVLIRLVLLREAHSARRA